MVLRIDRVDTELEILRKPSDEAAGAPSESGNLGADNLNTLRGRAAFREKLRPIVMEILNDELMRIKRKVGPP
jgi:hypothetical protein